MAAAAAVAARTMRTARDLHVRNLHPTCTKHKNRCGEVTSLGTLVTTYLHAAGAEAAAVRETGWRRQRRWRERR